MKPPTLAPAYLGLYVILTETARQHGYALAVHGTVTRDLDLVAIPWADEVSEPDVLIEALRGAVGGFIIPTGTKGGRYDAARGEFVEVEIQNPTLKPHGRLAWNIHLEAGAILDISVIPVVSSAINNLDKANKIALDLYRGGGNHEVADSLKLYRRDHLYMGCWSLKDLTQRILDHLNGNTTVTESSK
jgi:hypothetical protein